MYKYLTLFISSLFLFGCNSGSDPDSTSPETPTEVLINAESLQDKAILGTEGIINVQAATSSEVELELTSVTPMSDASNCKIDTIDGMAFSLSAEQVGECQFEYTVGPRDTEAFVGKASAIARVSVSETASDNTLPNLSETTDRLTEITIDLNAALSGDLDTSSYVVSGDISVLGTGSATAEPSTNKITFTPSEIGVDRVLYSMSDGSTTKLGTIDIAVSDTVNTPPVAENKVLEGKLAKDMLATIDLTDYVSDAEDVVLLDSVRAYNAEANITSQTEHTFTFKSSQPGPHEIAYTITDGRGGYDVGQVYIEVEPDFDLVQDWEDITIADPTIGADITFTAPVSQVLADYTNTSYSEAVMQDGVTGPQGSKVVTMSLEQAQSYCATRNGRLPIQREWSALMAEHGNLFESKNWPANTPYWSADMTSETSGVGIMAIDGLSAELTKATSAAFVTCVLLDSEKVADFKSFINYTTREFSNISDVYIEILDPDGAVAPYQDITVLSENSKGVFSNYEDQQILTVQADGTVNTTYTDLSFNDEVLSVASSALAVDSIVYRAEDAMDASELPVHDSSKWNRVAAEPGSLKPIDDIGIPSLYYGDSGSVRSISVFNDRSFTGTNFIGYVKIENHGEKDAISGKLSFLVQQESITPQSSWGDVSYQPGSPHTTRAFEIVTNYWNSRTEVFAGYGNSMGIENMDVKTHERHIWFENNNGQFLVYSSESSQKPAEPALEFPMNWAGIDPSKPYWVQVSSRIARDSNSIGVLAYVTDARFASYN